MACFAKLFTTLVCCVFIFGKTKADVHAMFNIDQSAVKEMQSPASHDMLSNLQAHEITSHSLTLQWQPPMQLEPIRYLITYDAFKEFRDSTGIYQQLEIPLKSISVGAEINSYTITSLMPFTAYQINVTAVPPDESHRPPSQISVTTAMTAPNPMFKPDIDKHDARVHVVLPMASEEYGPISHYYLVVVPGEYPTKPPDYFTEEELMTAEENNKPYIAARFNGQVPPMNFYIGDDETYNGFKNFKLKDGQKYRFFLRAIVSSSQSQLYRSSPYSDLFSLE